MVRQAMEESHVPREERDGGMELTSKSYSQTLRVWSIVLSIRGVTWSVGYLQKRMTDSSQFCQFPIAVDT